MYPHDPLCDRIRWLLRNLVVAQAWHKAVVANSPFAYKTFADNFGDSPYAKVALNLQTQPKIVPLMQATKLIVSPQLAPQLKQPVNFGLPKDGIKVGNINGQNNGQDNSGKFGGGLGINLPGQGNNNNPANGNGGKIVTLPSPGTNGTGNTGINGGKIVTLPVSNSGNGNVPANSGINGGRIGKLPVISDGRTGMSQDTKVDVKTSLPANRVTGLPARPQTNNGSVLKLNNSLAPSKSNQRNQGQVSLGGNGGNNNGGSRMAMGGSFVRRGF
jgi:hypothetical protein